MPTTTTISGPKASTKSSSSKIVDLSRPSEDLPIDKPFKSKKFPVRSGTESVASVSSGAAIVDRDRDDSSRHVPNSDSAHVTVSGVDGSSAGNMLRYEEQLRAKLKSKQIKKAVSSDVTSSGTPNHDFESGHQSNDTSRNDGSITSVSENGLDTNEVLRLLCIYRNT
jgi:hypothetical protein